jgi:hypothetical protein
VTTLTIHFSLLIPYLFKKKLTLLLFFQEKTQSSKQRERRNLKRFHLWQSSAKLKFFHHGKTQPLAVVGQLFYLTEIIVYDTHTEEGVV